MKAIKQFIEHKRLYNSTIFTKIYQKNLWGGEKGEYYSGSGSHNSSINGYTNIIVKFIIENKITTIIEIGCGDFYVGNMILKALELNNHLYSYVGYDVV